MGDVAPRGHGAARTRAKAAIALERLTTFDDVTSRLSSNFPALAELQNETS
jgi:hypothetical protein